jgi:hypothetical protein
MDVVFVGLSAVLVIATALLIRLCARLRPASRSRS